MAIFLQRAEQAYLARPQPYSVTGTIPDGTPVASIKVTLTRVAWPAGPVGSCELVYPDGNTSGFAFSGGVTINPRTGLVDPLSSCQFYAPEGQTFPVGDYTLNFTVLQTVTTALKIERF